MRRVLPLLLLLAACDGDAMPALTHALRAPAHAAVPRDTVANDTAPDDTAPNDTVLVDAPAPSQLEAPAPEAETAPSLAEQVALPRTDALPEVGKWLAPARRCGRQGRRRFCNGPRRAPAPHGPAGALAARLGLGTHRAAAELVRAEPRGAWMEALKTELDLQPSAAPLHWPVDGARFGRGVTWRGRGRHRRPKHRGVDFTAEVGTPVRAVADALVAYADNTIDGYGNLLVLLHGGGEVSAYAHLEAIHVFPGQLVRAGQPVARAGNTGISRGPHLHMEWRAGGRVVDPMRRFPRAHLPGWMVREFEGEEALVCLRAGRP
ncbi:MAG: hypothetical protein CMN29_15385 [Sandaracinus sp.]|nr:hypothetical protein [Sandaracinus sp.]